MTPEALAALHAVAMPGKGWSARSFANLLSDPTTILDDDHGSFALGRLLLDEAELLLLVTHPEHQRRGLGTARLSGFESLAAKRGANRAFLEVSAGNAPARRLYSSAGWQEISVRRGYYRQPGGEREDGLILSKNLTVR